MYALSLATVSTTFGPVHVLYLIGDAGTAGAAGGTGTPAQPRVTSEAHRADMPCAVCGIAVKEREEEEASPLVAVCRTSACFPSISVSLGSLSVQNVSIQIP
jgi:hypothetical protein